MVKWRLVAHEVLDVLAQDEVEVTWSGDQHVVEAFPAECPDEAFRNSVRPRWGER